MEDQGDSAHVYLSETKSSICTPQLQNQVVGNVTFNSVLDVSLQNLCETLDGNHVIFSVTCQSTANLQFNLCTVVNHEQKFKV